ncbi:MAG TPA: hypothetical protein VLW85_03650, partial [Myxococcales bacterium]|nr:hypothetical protein [Myxococcales bacterium]
IIPYIMRSRADAQNSFEDTLDIGPAEEWLRSRRAQGKPHLGFLHLLIAALVRTYSQRPRLNRFIAGQRIYARNELVMSLAIKKRLDEDSPETVVKLAFRPTDTVDDVARVIDAAVTENKAAEATNETDRAARLFMLLPGFVLRCAMWLLRVLDYHGRLPKALIRASPFHTSAFVTDLGSLRIRPVYHHLYEFGTTSVFVAFGLREEQRVIDEQGRPALRRTVGLKVVTDERICDGYYYASAFKYLAGLFRDPAQLERPPEAIVDDVE